MTPPVFTDCPAAVILNCGDALPAVASPSATDACSATATVVYNGQTDNAPQTCSTNLVYTRTWTATDACGNTALCSQTISYNPDVTPPVFMNCPAAVVLNCGDALPAVASPSATDACSATATVVYNGQTDNAPQTCSTNLVYTRTWTATDACGNTALCSQTISFNPDITPPVFTFCPGTVMINCLDPLPAVANPTATDACSGSATVVYNGQTSNAPQTCPTNVVYTRTWTATDACGNTTLCTQLIKYNTSAPVVPAGVVTNVSAVYLATTPLVVPTVVGVCGNVLTPSLVIINTPNPVICTGTRVYQYTYTDCSGLSSVWTFTYIIDLNDNNVCTIDACNPLTGIVTHTQVNRNDNNACTIDFCDPVMGVLHVPVNTNDNNACTNDFCNTLTGVYHVNVNTDDGNACTTDGCNTGSGPFHNPVVVNDGNICTVDACDPVTGVSNNPVNTNDNNICTIDACNTLTGVTHDPVPTSDGNACTIDGCSPLTGVYHNPDPLIEDNNPCTVDICNTLTGAISHPANPAIDDGNACSTDICNTSTGAITHTFANTDDGNACTVDACNTSNGLITHTPSPTDDSNPCTVDACNTTTGLVTHLPDPLIDDGNPCTVDVCNTSTGGITHVPNPAINDFNACTVDACNTTTGVITHLPVNASDGNACTVDACNTVTGQITNTPVPVDDSNACTVDACNTTTGLVTHLPNPLIDDGNPCTVDGCNTATGAIKHDPNPAINDFNACTVDACNTTTGVITHQPVNASDGNACTVDACNTVTGQITNTLVPTDDSNPCTVDACNTSTGLVTHLPNPGINDGNACTVDICNTSTGQVTHPLNPAIDDGNECTMDACNTATGGITHTPKSVTDGNACTIDACIPLTGEITHTNVPTDDSNLCTVDACNTLTGLVTHLPLPSIDDGNACTVDNCNSSTGITTHLANPAIDDGNLCTNDVCNTLSGTVAHIAVNTDDGNACTNDVCNPATGNVTHTSIPVNDNNACTTDGCNSLTGVYHNPISTDDGNACTLDVCDWITGLTLHYDQTPMVSATPDPILCYGNSTCVNVVISGGAVPVVLQTPTCVYFAGGPYFFTAIDAAGCVATSNPVVIVQPAKVEIDLITSTVSCGLNNGTATVYASGGTGTYMYSWSDGQTTNPATGLSGGIYSVTVSDANNCQAFGLVTVASGVAPVAPGPISGPVSVCKNQLGVAYSVPAVPGVLGYKWSVPANATIASGQGTNSITVNFGNYYTGGFIGVYDSTGCGNSPVALKNAPVITAKPAKPVITGPSTVCGAGQVTYCATSTNATSFNWVVDQGLSILAGQGTSCITVSVPANYNGNGKVKVRGVNCKGISEEKYLAVKKSTPLLSPPQFCIANSDDNFPVVCAPGQYEYEICLLSGAQCYTWTAPPGANISDRNGNYGNPLTVCSGNQNDVDVTFPAGFVSGVVTVSASNACGNTGISTFAVTGHPCRISGEELASAQGLSAYPNPTNGKLNVSFHTDVKEKYVLKVIDLIGKVMISEPSVTVEGINLRQLDLSGVAQGMYILSIERVGKEIQTLRIVVE